VRSLESIERQAAQLDCVCNAILIFEHYQNSVVVVWWIHLRAWALENPPSDMYFGRRSIAASVECRRDVATTTTGMLPTVLNPGSDLRLRAFLFVQSLLRILPVGNNAS
jgi:hypothetical protein